MFEELIADWRINQYYFINFLNYRIFTFLSLNVYKIFSVKVIDKVHCT